MLSAAYFAKLRASAFISFPCAFLARSNRAFAIHDAAESHSQQNHCVLLTISLPDFPKPFACAHDTEKGASAVLLFKAHWPRSFGFHPIQVQQLASILRPPCSDVATEIAPPDIPAAVIAAAPPLQSFGVPADKPRVRVNPKRRILTQKEDKTA